MMRRFWILPLAAVTAVAATLPLRSTQQQQLEDARLTPGSWIRLLPMGAGAPARCPGDTTRPDSTSRLVIKAGPGGFDYLRSDGSVRTYLLRIDSVTRVTAARDTFKARIVFSDSFRTTWRVSGAVEVAADGRLLHKTAWLRFRAYSPCARPPRDIFDLAARRGNMEFSGAVTAWPGDTLSVAGTAVFHQPVARLAAEQPLPLAGSGIKPRPGSPAVDTVGAGTTGRRR